MNKMKTILMAIAITAGIGGAVAATSRTAPTVYYKASNGEFYPAGIKDYDYVCEWDHWGTCTYTYNAATGQYVPYEAGKILFLR